MEQIKKMKRPLTDYKILFGISAISGEPIDGFEKVIYADEWLDFEFSYHPEAYYAFSMETMIGFESQKICVEYVHSILDEFTKWMKKNNFDTTQELDLYSVFTEGLNINSHFESIPQAYAAFKCFVNGFNGTGL